MKYNILIKQIKVTPFVNYTRDEETKRLLSEPRLDIKEERLDDLKVGTFKADALPKVFYFNSFNEAKVKAPVLYKVIETKPIDFTTDTQDVYVAFQVHDEESTDNILMDFLSEEVSGEKAHAELQVLVKEWHKQLIESNSTTNRICEIFNLDKEMVDLHELRNVLQQFLEIEHKKEPVLQVGSHVTGYTDVVNSATSCCSNLATGYPISDVKK